MLARRPYPLIFLCFEKYRYLTPSFDRPAFQEMVSDIKNGVINCVIVKDLSRLGREHIDTSRYLRQIFPAFGVRFISVNDNIDTENEQTGDDLVVSIKSILNDI